MGLPFLSQQRVKDMVAWRTYGLAAGPDRSAEMAPSGSTIPAAAKSNVVGGSSDARAETTRSGAETPAPVSFGTNTPLRRHLEQCRRENLRIADDSDDTAGMHPLYETLKHAWRRAAVRET